MNASPSPQVLDELVSLATSDYYTSLERKIRSMRFQLSESNDRYEVLARQHEAVLAALEEKQRREGELEEQYESIWASERQELLQSYEAEIQFLKRQLGAVQPPPAPQVRDATCQSGGGDVREDVTGTAVRELKAHYDELLAAERRHSDDERRTTQELHELKLRMERESFEFRLQSERTRLASDKDRIDEVKLALQAAMAEKDKEVAAVAATLEHEREMWAAGKAELHNRIDELLAKLKEQSDCAQALASSQTLEARHTRELHGAELKATEEKWRDLLAREQALRREVEEELQTVRGERNKVIDEQRMAVKAAEERLLATQLELTKCLEAQRESADRAATSERALAERERNLKNKTEQWSAMAGEYAKERATLQTRIDELQEAVRQAGQEREKARKELLEQQMKLENQRTTSHEQELLALRAQHADALDSLRRKHQVDSMNQTSIHEAKLKELSDQLLSAQQTFTAQLNRATREREDAVRQAKTAQEILDARTTKPPAALCVDAQVNTDGPAAAAAAGGHGPRALLDLQDSIMLKNKHIWQLQLELQEAREALSRNNYTAAATTTREDEEEDGAGPPGHPSPSSSSAVSSLSPVRESSSHARQKNSSHHQMGSSDPRRQQQPLDLPGSRGREVQSLVQYFTRSL